ncbi:MAG: M28 family peptidase [Myxococcota bacterium]|nr:M28 family peptidase [Myxococcota bacterium]MEC9441818.1 M28 family peptidase [Myxococcota bacterium]
MSDSSDPKKWIGGIIDACPRRVAGSESERRAHEMMQADAEALGLTVTLRPFRHNRSLYANMALHFAIALVGTALLPVAPIASLVIHLFVVVSYWLESNKKAMVLRHLFPFHDSQNLIATHAAKSALRKRIVFVSHIDAAFTGWVFHPTMIKLATAPPPIKALEFMRKSMLVGTLSVFLLALLDVAAIVLQTPTWLMITASLLSIPAFLTMAMNGQVVLNNTVVPGANDNLTGCWANLELARRLVPDCPEDIELVFVATGCEEAGTGGAWALSKQVEGEWSKENTYIMGIDSLTNGTLRRFIEGELLTVPPPRELSQVMEEHVPEVPPFQIPSGATDSLPFLIRGWQAASFGCVDEEIGAPRNYHWPTDNVENLDTEQLDTSVAQIERVARALFD